MPHGTLINGTNYGISGGKTRVNSTNYAVKSGKTEINSGFYNINFGTPVGSLAVGTSVYMNVDNVRTEFLIVHQGLPSFYYDNSCNGTWLLMKDIYKETPWNDSDNDYANSNVRYYCDGTFLYLFDNNIKNAIKQIKLPYWQGTGRDGSYQTGSSGLSTKVFLLSDGEVGIIKSQYESMAGVGTKLSYFDSGTGTAAKNKRMANYNGSAHQWGLRSPEVTSNVSGTTHYYGIGTGGNISGYECKNIYKTGVRPALILPSSATIDDNFNIIG